jgi:aerobic-type carbon monoxide dehydrogenase small subunit (CoxS/CutS family)
MSTRVDTAVHGDMADLFGQFTRNMAGEMPEATAVAQLHEIRAATERARQGPRGGQVDAVLAALDSIAQRLTQTGRRRVRSPPAFPCHLDGVEIQPCVVPVKDCAGRRVTTIEGLADGDWLHPVQQAWLDCDVAQRGFCQPGQIMAAVALLNRTPHAADADIDKVEIVCGCGTYPRVRQAIKKACGHS